MERILTKSNDYIISYEYEIVMLELIGKKKKIVIGDFYGDPETAFISTDESYCVIGGDGLIIYYLKEPFIEYEYGKKSKQWIEIFREINDIWWVYDIEKGSSIERIKFRIDPNDDKDRAGTYEVNVYTAQVKKLD
jgi:hypothetical protein